MPHTAINYDNTAGNVNTPVLRTELRLFKRLGNGTFGVAYLAEFRGRQLVVKLPVTLLRTPEVRVHPSVNPDGRTLAEVIKPPRNIRQTVFERARNAFRKECQNAEQVLDSTVEHYMRANRGNGSSADALVGAPLLEGYLSAEDQAVIDEARQRHRALPGYAHMHPIVHFDAQIPLLLSEPAQGTLEDLYVVIEDAPRLNAQWYEVARQLSDAIAFLRHPTVGMAHLDLKPDNVLYTHHPTTGRVHIWVGDYGQMDRANKRTTFVYGAPAFKPDDALALRMEQRGATCDDQQLFAYYATILDLIHFPTANNFNTRLLNLGNNIISVALPQVIKQRSSLVMYASADLYQHVMAPLLEPSVYVLGTLFERTRAWLYTMAPPQP
jgi:hypothetical protein